MFAPLWICGLLRFAAAAAAAASPPQQIDIVERTVVQSKIQAFVQSLQLVPSQNQSLISRLEGSTAVSSIHLACEVAQLSLGAGGVEASNSVNLTEVEVNWSVQSLRGSRTAEEILLTVV